MRTLCWFSCGAPSAVAAKLTLATDKRAEVVYTRIEEEHPDNMRFLLDCEHWLGVPIRSIGNLKYNCSIYEVFERERYLVGIQGAPCTKLLKRRVREEYQRPDDNEEIGVAISDDGLRAIRDKCREIWQAATRETARAELLAAAKRFREIAKARGNNLYFIEAAEDLEQRAEGQTVLGRSVIQHNAEDWPEDHDSSEGP